MKIQTLLVTTSLFAVLAGCTKVPEGPWRLTSPDGRLAVEVSLRQPERTLAFRVLRISDGAETAVIEESPLGIERQDAAFTRDLEFIAATPPEPFHVEYELAHGKVRRISRASLGRTLTFAEPGGRRMSVVLRAFDDGVAFRYRFAEESSEEFVVTREATGFRIPSGSFGYLLPFDPPGQYTPAYENFFQRAVPLGTKSPTGVGWAFPALFEVRDAGAWVLLTESDLDESYCGGRLEAVEPAGLYHVRFPEPGEGQGYGETEPRHTLPWQTPWRVVVVGDDPGAILETTLVTDLARPAESGDWSWVRPGRVAWSWWSKQDSPKQLRGQLKFIDFAAEMGWEYVLVDANWDEMGEGAVERLVQYAEPKGVGILLWYNSGGPHNIVTEKPRDRMFEPEARRREMEWLQKVGVKGVKVDFFQSDKQAVIGLYLAILRDAAEHRLMVNFHGCTLPRGWERTYPHLMSMEAVRGAESYIFDPTYPERAPWHNTILPFTRNAVGPMDYTPVTFSNNRYPHLTTNGHELALAVLFESGWLHLADSPESYRSQPAAVREFLQGVPVAWEETRYLAGKPGEWVVVARRSGRDWYLAGASGLEESKEVSLDLSALGLGAARGLLITDGAGGKQFEVAELSLEAGQPLSLQLLPRGGFVARLAP
ncbi:MAG: glycoside hydrolase family 97 protein [Acidobacteriota bacterium]